MDALLSQIIIKMPCGILKVSGDLLRFTFRIGGLCLDLDIVNPHVCTRCETFRDELLIALLVMDVIGLLASACSCV
ncbi:hypothetical protein [Erwinia typographi]|uniref:hypothetical protein n=1 Tax=Erwinia typographi TaxID=371042 RepID=UPI0012ECCC70|nr:hypothetical protein [Erwinia typographi]